MPVVVPINYMAIVVATVVGTVLGFLWYGPLFGKQWMAMMGFTKESMEKAKKGMGKNYALMIVGSLLMNYVLAHALVFAATYMKIEGVQAGVAVGFWNWLGFIAPVQMSAQLWEGKPWKLWFLNSGFYLVSLVISGIILATWR